MQAQLYLLFGIEYLANEDLGEYDNIKDKDLNICISWAHL